MLSVNNFVPYHRLSDVPTTSSYDMEREHLQVKSPSLEKSRRLSSVSQLTKSFNRRANQAQSNVTPRSGNKVSLPYDMNSPRSFPLTQAKSNRTDSLRSQRSDLPRSHTTGNLADTTLSAISRVGIPSQKKPTSPLPFSNPFSATNPSETRDSWTSGSQSPHQSLTVPNEFQSGMARSATAVSLRSHGTQIQQSSSQKSLLPSVKTSHAEIRLSKWRPSALPVGSATTNPFSKAAVQTKREGSVFSRPHTDGGKSMIPTPPGGLQRLSKGANPNRSVGLQHLPSSSKGRSTVLRLSTALSSHPITAQDHAKVKEAPSSPSVDSWESFLASEKGRENCAKKPSKTTATTHKTFTVHGRKTSILATPPRLDRSVADDDAQSKCLQGSSDPSHDMGEDAGLQDPSKEQHGSSQPRRPLPKGICHLPSPSASQTKGSPSMNGEETWKHVLQHRSFQRNPKLLPRQSHTNASQSFGKRVDKDRASINQKPQIGAKEENELQDVVPPVPPIPDNFRQNLHTKAALESPNLELDKLPRRFPSSRDRNKAFSDFDMTHRSTVNSHGNQHGFDSDHWSPTDCHMLGDLSPSLRFQPDDSASDTDEGEDAHLLQKHGDESLQPSTSATLVQEPGSHFVTEPMPSQYWAGRYMSRNDKKMNELGIDETITRTEDQHKAAHSRKVQRHLDVFQELEDQCATLVARQSLWRFRNAFAIQHNLKEILVDEELAGSETLPISNINECIAKQSTARGIVAASVKDDRLRYLDKGMLKKVGSRPSRLYSKLGSDKTDSPAVSQQTLKTPVEAGGPRKSSLLNRIIKKPKSNSFSGSSEKMNGSNG